MSFDLADEYVKVRKKQSDHPRQLRDLIVHVYENDNALKTLDKMKRSKNKGTAPTSDEVFPKKENIFVRFIKWILGRLK